LLDLERQRVIFEQGVSEKAKLHDALADPSPNVIDVGSLGNHAGNAQFFLSQVRMRLEPPRRNEPISC